VARIRLDPGNLCDRLKVDIIVTGGTPPVVAAKRATSVIPIVFATAGDPVGMGLVASLARPGGNVTGLSVLSFDLAGKRLDLLREAIPSFRRLAIMAREIAGQHCGSLGKVAVKSVIVRPVCFAPS
jgi:ABC-type uncharacterized transport system substrate-binding protein